MITFEHYNNILDLDDLNLESSLSTLTVQDKKKIGAVSVLQAKEKVFFQQDMSFVFRNFLDFCRKGHNVYFVLLENYPRMRSKIRSKKGLFYKEKEYFEKGVFLETEVDVEPGESLFAGIIRLTENNIDYLVNRPDDFPFAFGFIAPRGKKAFKTNRKNFLEAVVLEGLKPGEIYWKNWLKMATLLVKPGRKLFSLQDLNEVEYFRVFYHKGDTEWASRWENAIKQMLQTETALQN